MIKDSEGKIHTTYKEYLLSDHWKKIRDKKRMECGGCCERCHRTIPKKIKKGSGAYIFDIEIHHKHYDSLGREELHDLNALCNECHPIGDKRRKHIKEQIRYWNAVRTFSMKKYGSDYDLDGVSDEFDRWVESKND